MSYIKTEPQRFFRAGGEESEFSSAYPPAPERKEEVPTLSTAIDPKVGLIAPGSKLDDLVDDFKRRVVRQALRQSGGNHRRASELLGIHRSSLTRMLHRLTRAEQERQNTWVAQPSGKGD